MKLLEIKQAGKQCWLAFPESCTSAAVIRRHPAVALALDVGITAAVETLMAAFIPLASLGIVLLKMNKQMCPREVGLD